MATPSKFLYFSTPVSRSPSNGSSSELSAPIDRKGKGREQIIWDDDDDRPKPNLQRGLAQQQQQQQHRKKQQEEEQQQSTWQPGSWKQPLYQVPPQHQRELAWIQERQLQATKGDSENASVQAQRNARMGLEDAAREKREMQEKQRARRAEMRERESEGWEEEKRTRKAEMRKRGSGEMEF